MKSKVDSKNGRVVTSVQISLAKPTNQRAGNKIQLTQTPPSKKMITYTREFLLSLRSTNSKAPKMMNIDSKFEFCFTKMPLRNVVGILFSILAYAICQMPF